MNPITKPSILYVDDEKQNLLSFEWVLNDIYDIHTALSGDIALEILKKHEIKVLISDERMPGMSGLELIKKVNTEFPNIICIVLTAYTDVDLAVKAINQGGIYHFMTKPWDGEELKANLRNAVETYDLKYANEQLIDDVKQKNELLESHVEELKSTTEALFKSEEKFRNIFNSNPEGILILDFNLKVLAANNSFLKYYNLKQIDLLSKDLTSFMMPKNVDIIKKKLMAIIEGNKIKEFEIKLDFDGRKTPFEIKSLKIEYQEKEALLVLIKDITERKEIRKRILQAMIQAEESERGRIAKDLHDGIGPLLSASNIYINSLMVSDDEERKKAALSRLSETVDEAINTVQEISNNVSPHILRNYGLVVAINSFLSKLDLLNKVDIKLNSNFEHRLNGDIEITLYRITIELLNNSLKYSKAKNIEISILKNDRNLQYKYFENGKGFDVEEIRRTNKGMGISNIYSRIESVNGSIDIKSEPGEGVKVISEIPI